MVLNNGDILMSWPLALHIITAGWFYNDGSKHSALDFRCTVGTPVFAACDGTVTTCYRWNGKVTQGDNNSYGNFVKMQHANYQCRKLETLYAHLNSICVSSGQQVTEGQLIGYSGVTGNCSGAHLHFEVIFNGLRVNPLCWLDSDFVTASNAVKLGTYTSVTRPQVPAQDANAANSGLQTITIGPISLGDAMRFWQLAKDLKIDNLYQSKNEG